LFNHNKAGRECASGLEVNNQLWRLTLMQQLLGVGGLFALRLKERIDALPHQVLPARPARCSQSARFYGDDLPWMGAPGTDTHTKDQPAQISTVPVASTNLSNMLISSDIRCRDFSFSISLDTNASHRLGQSEITFSLPM